MRILALGVLVLAACGTAPQPEGLRAPGEPSELALERLEQECPDYYERSSPEQRSNLVNRVIAPDYPECVVRFALGDPQARREVPNGSGSEWWYYDREPGYLQITMEEGRLTSWKRCETCRRWYEN
jgi:hypothetical protein